MSPFLHRHSKWGIAIGSLIVALLFVLAATVALAQSASTAKIAGHVTDRATGDSLIGVSVDVLVAGRTGEWSSAGQGVTDASGYYDVGELAAGTYKVLFQDGSGYYGLQYYKGKTTLASANSVTLGAGTMRTGIDAALVEASHITGMVTDKATGDPIEGIDVAALLPDGSMLSSLHAFTDSSGYYDVGGLAGGTYKLLFQDGSGYYGAQYYKGKASFASALPMTLRAGALKEGVDASLVEAAHITGRVTDKVTGDPIADIGVQALLPDGSMLSSQHAFTDASGYYDVGGLAAGSYRLAFDDASGYYARQYSARKPVLALADRVTLGAGANVDAVNATLVQAETEAPITSDDAPTGWLTDGANVTLTPADAGSGVFATYYKLNGGAVRTYTGPIAMFDQGANTLEYWSMDWAGNVEVAHKAGFVVVATPAANGTPSTPFTPSSVRHGASFVTFGTIVRHVPGSSAVTLQFSRYEHGHWVLRKSTTATASDIDGLAFSKYSDSTSLPYAGQWRVRAMHKAGSRYQYSGSRTFTVS